ncbi:5-deoxy-glucuronate isomerase [Cryobacterium sp. PH31-L1]|uniref:5-deoxy-glucuronate isomerase n=1 Tax=Cryobacterium sp. PH31-L1 TaxID=3046199 RepID=UPI0024BA0645|nr:5-deoxy-glucuronate isomerase [Cryobacterium sp. PH31-L1]MDJ0378513.1 5-deoxy-glucuronate isomerase [Cryobacterium sp. PH31-L1]
MTTPSADWFYAQGSLERDGWESVVDRTISGWRYTGIRVAALAAGDTVSLNAEAVERIVVPLAGSFTVRYTLAGETEERVQALAGRASVFHGPTDTLYLPTGAVVSIDGAGRVAVAEAPTDRELPVAYIPQADVPIELRGAGRSSRQVHNFGTPASLAADRLIVCEVITPAENWSSYPPHKHDEYTAGVESQLEEIYYFESAVTRGQSAPETANPFGLMRTYSSEAGDIDIMAEVHTGDVALVPFGWHGPCVAAPGYDLYYLNVMAGPDPDRSWRISDDPAHGWIRDTWVGQAFDSRLPYTA